MADKKLRVVTSPKKSSTPSYQEMIDNAFAAAQSAVDKRRELEEEAARLKKAEENHLMYITRLNKIACFEVYTKVGEWREPPEARRSSHLLRQWEMKTSTYEMSVFIKERTELKSYKFEVHINGRKYTLSTAPHEVNGGYSDYDYGRKKYEAQNLQKFKTLKEAEDAAEKLMALVLEDHAEHIEEEQALAKHMHATGFKFDKERRWWTRYYK